jgi:hypothetical protein
VSPKKFCTLGLAHVTRERSPRHTRTFPKTILDSFLLVLDDHTMLASIVRRSRVSASIRSQVARAQSTSVDKTAEGPIGEDGRHEIWREGIYDHDNEPK